MYISNRWKDFEVLDAGDGEKIERWKDVILVRPDPQVIWHTDKSKWKKINAIYHRSSKGGGEWEIYNLPKRWSISYPLLNNESIEFNIKPFSFKHTGLFPEQAVNWDFLTGIVKNNDNVLNLFAYTGGASVALLKMGANVVHVDSSKGMIEWAKENAISSNVNNKNIKYYIDDCFKFVEREIRRGHKYEGIIMDPPSYGRGPNGEIWKLESALYKLIDKSSLLLYNKSKFFIINSYTTGLQSAVLSYILNDIIVKKFGGKVESDEIGLPVTKSKLMLPCGCCGRWIKT
ncbi:MAG: class I SAM-dependent methyltransferase [Eubacteriales bacterium]|nr:class I SAM-dependent methyltransferase [Eubacteriales bacterium]